MLYEVPVLDDGFVRLVYSYLNKQQLQDLEATGARFNIAGLDLAGARGMTLAIRAPAFIFLQLARFNLVNVGSLADSKLNYMKIQLEDLQDVPLEIRYSIIEETSDISNTLMKAPHKLITRGCDNLIAQTVLPVSTYSTSIFHGTVSHWKGFVEYQTSAIYTKKYQSAVKEILRSEFDIIT